MNGEHFLIYTTEEGGLFKAQRGVSEAEYERIKATGEIRYRGDRAPGEPDIVIAPLVFIALVRVEKNHDFVLGCARDDKRGIGMHVAGAAS